MRYTALVLLLSGVLLGCGSSSSNLTNNQELSALQGGTWSGASETMGTATFAVSGANGALSIASATCPVTFNLGLTMQPGKTLAGSQFSAGGTADENGYQVSSLTGTFVSSNKITLDVAFQTPCQTSANAQFTLTQN
jgi:hypothetical protein